MRYCKKCVLPETRPGAALNDEGVCCACVGHMEKGVVIDWDKRKQQFEELVFKIKKERSGNYDCLIPVSGGKDSTYQVYMIKQVYKLNPLCVTWRTPSRTALGQENLDNMRNMGVDHIDFAISPETERKFIYKTLVKSGTPSLSAHMATFSITLRCAVNYNIPLIIWGESTQMEYGGSLADRQNPYLDHEWIKKYGCCDGTTAHDWIDEDLTEQDMIPYTLPKEDALRKAKIQSVFLGYYFNWDPLENFNIAKKVGFQERKEGSFLGLYNFADLDCNFLVIHHFIKWYKFGMIRLYDNIGTEIRNGRMTREAGVKLIKETGVKVPIEQVKILCEFLKISEDHFWSILEKFRNLEIWKKNENGDWHITDYLKGL